MSSEAGCLLARWLRPIAIRQSGGDGRIPVCADNECPHPAREESHGRIAKC